MIRRSKSLLTAAALAVASCGSALALNTDSPAMTDESLIYYLTNIADAHGSAGGAVYGLRDDVGNPMYSPSILQVTGQKYKYAAVYLSDCRASTSGCERPDSESGIRFKMYLAGSDDLLNWTRIGLLADNADMPRIARVEGSDWLIIVHEQWGGKAAVSTSPSRISYRLYHSESDLMNLTTREVWTAPLFGSDLNGTPSIYHVYREEHEGKFGVGGAFGFHYFDKTRDVNAVNTTLRLFHPDARVVYKPSIAAAYNDLFDSLGVKGNIGQRDTLVTETARYNIQEGNLNADGDFSGWRIWLYKFGDEPNYPTGKGTVTLIEPKTPMGSTSFGNPSVAIVDRPDDTGKAIVISYTIFAEGGKGNEVGPVLYYFNI